jgi:outer membrane protein OmpA-like peptidoglycan-associated protein
MHARMYRTVSVLAALLSIGVLNAQKWSLKMGDKAYEGLAYHDAIGHYEEALVQGADSGAFLARLAESYLNVRDFARAAAYYAPICAGTQARAVDLYNYSQCLRATGQYELADKWLMDYANMAAADGRAERQKGSAHYATDLLAKPISGCEITNASANSALGDMGAAFWNERLVFASARTTRSSEQRMHSWNGDPYLDLFSAGVGENGILFDVRPMEGLNTRFHESHAAFVRQGQEVWFTRNNFSNGKKATMANDVVNLKIYARTLAEGKWQNEVTFPHNSDAYSVGHPALSADGNTLYFTSDMPGGIGATDIWMCTREGEGAWSAPVNLGAQVNTEGREMFPFVQVDGTLYFSSDGHAGLGGLDIFQCKASGGAFSKANNVGAPLNSGNDDFSIQLDSTGLAGYLTSDRPGGLGSDDLYRFTLTAPLGRSILMTGRTLDAVTRAPIANTEVVLSNTTSGTSIITTTGPTGEYTFSLEADANYEVKATAASYVPTTAQVGPIPSADTTLVQDLSLAVDGTVTLWYNVRHAFTKIGLAEAKVDRIRVSGIEGLRKSATYTTDNNGDVREVLEGAQIGDSIVFYIELSKKGFSPKKGMFRHKITQFGEVDVHQALDLCLFPLEGQEYRLTCSHDLDRSGMPVSVGRDLRAMIDMKPIFFDVGKYAIRPDAATELDKIVGVLNAYPGMTIELGSHTDSRGSDASNKTLSDERAKSSVAYVVGKGIAQERVAGKGYGETRLVNKCRNGVKCSEADHQANRRTEFIIVKM